jgi:hypothetical protein
MCNLWCGSNVNIEIHHVRSLRKRSHKGDFLEDIMSKMSQKQVPLWKSCHLDAHAHVNRHDERAFKVESNERE